MRTSIIVILVCACEGSKAPPHPPPRAVDIATLQPTRVVDSTEYLATLRSRTAATLQPHVEGQITDIYVHPGAPEASGP